MTEPKQPIRSWIDRKADYYRDQGYPNELAKKMAVYDEFSSEIEAERRSSRQGSWYPHDISEEDSE